MSSKTQKANGKKTKSALDVKFNLLFLLLFILVGLVIYGLFITSDEGRKSSDLKTSDSATICLNLPSGSCSVFLEVADDNSERLKGLSNRESLAQDRGMIFIFEREEELCFWMKDTLIPLDMIWLNSEKEVTKIQHNVSPDTYPTAFCSEQVDKYVIELNAGQAKQRGIAVGQTLVF